jgi:uncharacterized protein YecE (DUF72 family)
MYARGGEATRVTSYDSREPLRIGTAGWTIPRESRAGFAPDGSQLERYAARLNCVEINSSFYRPHRSATYARWASSVPEQFAFSLKLPKAITHVRRCVDCDDAVAEFLESTSALGSKRRVLLVQLPPSFAYAAAVVVPFFVALRKRYAGFVVCEPRHPSWFDAEVDATLLAHRVARVAADPALCAGAGEPGGSREISYCRLHGAPRTYYSKYAEDDIARLVTTIAKDESPERWCIFDNTASGAASRNALQLLAASQPRIVP